MPGTLNWVQWGMILALASGSSYHRRPSNIVFLMVDDMGWNDVSFHGSDQILTPNIDALAYHAIVLKQYYSEAICTPARTALLTGKYPMRLGMHGMPLYNSEDRGIPLTERLLPSYLKELGYSTHLVGKWHVGMSRQEYLPTSRGYDTHYGMRGGFIDYYTYNKVETWPNGRQLFGLDLYDGPVPQTEEQRYIVDALTDRAVRDVMAQIDRSVGRIVQALADKNVLDDTILIFASDNGAPTVGDLSNWGVNLPFRGKKNTPWEGAVRVPAFIWHSSFQPRIWDGLMHITDWMPTLLAAAGRGIEKQIDGVNQWDSILQDGESNRREVLIAVEDSARNTYAAYRAGDYKIVVGNVSGLSNGYYGEDFMINKGPTQEYYPTLVNCGVARIFEDMGYYLTPESVYAMRNANVIKQEDPVSDSTPCIPTLNRGCLFNVHRDPAERHDLWIQAPKIAELLTSRLRSLWAMQLRRGPPNLRNESDPANYNYIWQPWINEVKSNVIPIDKEIDSLNLSIKVSSNRTFNKETTHAAAINCNGTSGLRNFLCILRSVF